MFAYILTAALFHMHHGCSHLTHQLTAIESCAGDLGIQRCPVANFTGLLVPVQARRGVSAADEMQEKFVAPLALPKLPPQRMYYVFQKPIVTDPADMKVRLRGLPKEVQFLQPRKRLWHTGAWLGWQSCCSLLAAWDICCSCTYRTDACCVASQQQAVPQQQSSTAPSAILY